MIKFYMIGLLGIITTGIQDIYSLRAQESQCYEFICGIDEAFLCGSDGVTYLNGCQYSQAQCLNPNLFVVFPGPCENDDSNSSSTVNPQGQDQVEATTVSNPSTVSDTACTNNAYCTTAYQPICGSDGVTYPNKCEFNIKQCKNSALSIKHEGKCKNSGNNCKFKICPLEENPICASDGKTYRNDCEYTLAKCYDESLVPIAVGSCAEDIASSDPNCNRTCDDQYHPICATDGQTYKNICFFEKARCKNLTLKIYKFQPC